MIGIHQQSGLLVHPAPASSAEAETLRERERLRRELLRRIVVREAKRQARRGGGRLP